jgi:flagellum-specific peptidoglycan hydrolase FlgJ
MIKERFIAAATAAAQVCSRVSGFPAGVTVAQAALESRWGDSRLAREAHNYFGIKARRGRPFVVLETLEASGAALVKTTARFARYASMDDCFADRDRILATVSCYAEARAAADDPEQFIPALAAHWATDPHYAEKLLALYHTHGFDRLDNSNKQ